MKKYLSILLLLYATAALAQQDSLIRLKLIVGGGWGFRTSDIDIPNNQLDVSTRSPCASLRIMWKPQHRLSVGIESGYLPITQVEGKGQLNPNDEDGNANLAAIPILATFAMDQFGVELSAGIGAYSLMISGKSNNGRGIENSALELGYSFGASYSYAFSPSFGLGLQIKYYVFTDREIAMIAPQLRLEWAMLSY